jgi:hypothetical protein
VTGNEKDSPIITGYAKEQPEAVEEGGKPLDEVSSLGRLKMAKFGWFWDGQTRLWHVRVNFSGITNVETKQCTIIEKPR